MKFRIFFFFVQRPRGAMLSLSECMSLSAAMGDAKWPVDGVSSFSVSTHNGTQDVPYFFRTIHHSKTIIIINWCNP